MNNLSKLILGTVQFGLNYGINNSSGKPSLHVAQDIVSTARHEGITTLDTADAYGNSQEVLAKCDIKDFLILSKFILPPGGSIRTCLTDTLRRLELSKIDAYSFHRFSDFISYGDMRDVDILKAEGSISKLGVSVYTNEEAEAACLNPFVDLIQLPFNLLDNMNLRRSVFELAGRRNKTVHVRSVFLQGLFFKKVESLSGNLCEFRRSILEIQELSAHHQMSIESLCISYALSIPEVSGIVLGVDNVIQLNKNLEAFRLAQDSDEIRRDVEAMSKVDTALLNPGNWTK